MKAILSQNKDKLVLDLISDENSKHLLEDDMVHKDLNRTAELLGFEGIGQLVEKAIRGDETIFEFKRVYDSNKPFAFDVLEEYFNEMKIDENLNEELKDELENNYKSDLAASAIECIADNFVYVVLNQLTQLMINELEIDVESFRDKTFYRIVEIVGANAGKAEISIKYVNYGKNQEKK
ncbi:hypothetical protein GF389_05815 [Candidatus Dojkabacteria bacterium]|nr:hypothetical protein [Candidatus Dojkabacteria bacterium]